ncbi:MAG: alpha/beta hydrolase [Planctomycetaceae bacterium]|nr:alpha/beta hydrolase [Planctomycetaceae bacterium]
MRAPSASACFAILAAVFSSSLRAADPVYTQQQDVVIAESYGLAVPMDIFTPAGEKNGLAIVDVASGAWHSDRGKIRDHQRALFYDILCGRGYHVFAVRPGSISRFHAADMVANIETTIRWVKEHATDYAIDPARLGLTGASAGGHLASLVGLKTSRPGDDAARVAAVAVFFPPTDFVEWAGVPVDPRAEGRINQIAAQLAFPEGLTDLDDAQIQEKLVLISPSRQAHADSPPFLLIHGDADPLVPLKQSELLRDALAAASVPVQLIVKEGGGHPWLTIPEEVAKLADWFDERLGK